MSVDELVGTWTGVERARWCIVGQLRTHPGSSTTALRQAARAERVSVSSHSAALRTLEDDGTICRTQGAKNARLWRLAACLTSAAPATGVETLSELSDNFDGILVGSAHSAPAESATDAE